jgi:hypothetical protein
MRRTRNDHDVSSFDMLLDTMCNTFGGIVFIALLLSIVSNTATKHSQESGRTGGHVLRGVRERAEVARLRGEADMIADTIRLLEERSAPSLARGGARAVVVESNLQLIAQGRLLRERESHLEARLAALREDVNAAEAQVEERLRQTEEMRAGLARARKDSAHHVRLPRLRTAPGMQSCFFALSGGRLYAVSDVSGALPSTGGRGYDLQDVDVESGEGLDVVKLRRDAGEPVHPGCEQRGKLALAIRNCSKDAEILSFVVSPDSFAAFNYVKRALVDRGFSYNWIPEARGTFRIRLVSEALQAQ